MERRAASHTEEEEMNQRRKLLNAAKRGDQKAIAKLFELYQVRVMSPDQLTKINKVYAAMPLPVKASKSGKTSAKGAKQPPAKPAPATKAVKSAKPAKPAKSVKTAKPAPPKAATHPAKRKAK